ncbi:transposable element Tc1 transposase [Trichonephila clavipes]|nr:transposable element Tc1 transposase [Trichonephila clavipes]
MFENWLEEDIIEKVEPFNEDDNEHFLTHHPVFKENSTTKEIDQSAEWRHISGSLNLADLPSRGCNIENLSRSRWWDGPEWLKLPSTDWPQSEINSDLETINSEKRKTIVSATSCEVEEFKFITRISSYAKIIRIVAWMFRFCQNLKEKEYKKKRNLTVQELEKSEKFLLVQVQKVCFDSENNIHLRTFKDVQGIIKVETRIASRKDLETFRFPILLPNKHPIVEKLIMYKHLEFGHVGSQTLMSILRESYLIIKNRKTEDFGKQNMPWKRARRHFSQLSEFESGLIIGMKTAGRSTRHVAVQVDRSECAVRNCWEQWTREGTHVRKTGSGATRKTTRREDRRIVRQALVDPTVTRSTIRADVGVAIVPQTISRPLAEANLKSKPPFRALPLTSEHRQLRLQWCQARSMWNITDWQKVVFSDESRFV